MSDENSKSFWSMYLGTGTKIHPSSPPLFKIEVLRDIGHSMSIRNLILGVNSVTISYLINYDSLLQMRQILQNARAILLYVMRQKFITKCVGFLWKNASVLLQNATVITNCDDFITKCDSYSKMRCLLQIATVHCEM